MKKQVLGKPAPGRGDVPMVIEGMCPSDVEMVYY